MLTRWLVVPVVLLMTVATPARAVGPNLFDHTTHDFGTVPRGPMLRHEYRLTNDSGAPLHVAGIRVSCGCVAATVSKADLAPGESTTINATMDTRRFSGSKSVVIYVTFDRPRWAEVPLTISAFGRDDLTLDNEIMHFGSLTRDASGSAKVTVTLRQPRWVVQGVKSSSRYVEPEVKEVRRTPNEAVYEITGNLQPGLPVGQWVADITLTTNSTIAPQIRVPAIVDIAPVLTVSPAAVTFAPATVGKQAESRFMVKSAKPFRITEIQGGDEIVTAASNSDEARPVHIVTVKLTAKEAGPISRTLKILTDIATEGTAEVVIHAQAND